MSVIVTQNVLVWLDLPGMCGVGVLSRCGSAILYNPEAALEDAMTVAGLGEGWLAE